MIADRSFDLDGTLVVGPGGRISVPPAAGGNSLTLSVSGDIVIGRGGVVSGDVRGVGDATGVGASLRLSASGRVVIEGDGETGGRLSSNQDSDGCTAGGGQGGQIHLEVGGDFASEAGSVIAATSTGCAAGSIFITAAGRVQIDGLIASGPSTEVTDAKLTGKVLKGGGRLGGEIVVRSRGDSPGIVVGSAGVIVSQAVDRSRGVTLDACGIRIHGLIASLAATRDPDRPNIILRSTHDLTIRGEDLGRPGSRQGRVRADGLAADPGTRDGDAFRVDILVRRLVAIHGPASGDIFAVSSNPRMTTGSPPSGQVTVLSLADEIVASGLAIEAGRNAIDKTGGVLSLAAAGSIDLTGATLSAVGDHEGIRTGAGGTISVRSFGGAVRWRAGTGDVRPTGTGTAETNRGTIAVSSCTGIDTQGADFPHAPPGGNPTGPLLVSGDCTGSPSLPPDALPLPACSCVTSAECDDQNVCNGVEACNQTTGRCDAGTALLCDDGNACTGIERCDPVLGCRTGTPVVCSDADLCNGLETCDPATGACTAGTPLVCDDGNACTGIERCDPVLGCRTGTPVVCSDADPCNGLETCDPATGCVAGTPRLDGTSCSDEDACNGEEICAAGACGPPEPETARTCVNSVLRHVISDFDTGTAHILRAGPPLTVTVGAGPWGVALHPDGTHAYVTNRKDNTLSVIDAATWTEIDAVPVGDLPLGVIVDPRGLTIFVASYNDDRITLIDAATRTIMGAWNAGAGPTGLAFDRSGTRLYVTNFADDTLSVLDPRTGRTVATIPVGRQPLGIAVDETRLTAYVTNFASNDVSVVGLRSNTVLTTIPVGDKPFGVGASGTAGLAYVANAGGDTVSVIDTRVNTVVDTLQGVNGPLGVDFDATGERAFVVSGEDRIVATIETLSGTTVASEPAGDLPVAFGRFAGAFLDTCGSPVLDCDDGDALTSESCTPPAGCAYERLTGLAAAAASLSALRRIIEVAPVGALGTGRTSDRIERLVERTQRRFEGISTPSAPARQARKIRKQTTRRVKRFLRLMKRGIRKDSIPRPMRWPLLDLGRAALAALDDSRPGRTRVATARVAARPAPPGPPIR
jgi:YVTN family beta-propeller protein